jgi:hypothetical protein
VVVFGLLAGGLPGRAGAPPANGPAVPRTVLALYDSRAEQVVTLSRVHRLLEMPLNHLGLVVAFRDVAQGLPDLSDWPDLRGVVTWFGNAPFDDPRVYVAWAGAAMDRGIRFVVMEQPGVHLTAKGERVPLAVVNRFLGRFGLRDDDGYSDITYRSHPVVADPEVVGFEKDFSGVLPGYPLFRKVDGRVTSHLAMRRGDDAGGDSHLVVTGPAGGLVAHHYAIAFDPELGRRQWIINPFAFLRRALASDDLPKPDVTTVSGRRLYFSHIDGDGWRNVSEIDGYAKDKVLSAEVIRREAVEPYPDLPVSVAPIVGDIDPHGKGTPQSLDAARRLFALPQVEPTAHTWTHPFLWSFFRDYTREKEAAVSGGAGGPVRGLLRAARDEMDALLQTGGEGASQHLHGYAVPRAYTDQPFDLAREIGGALDFVAAQSPPGRAARLVQWSGDTSPYEEAVREARLTGAHNINGGDSRFDPEFPSYSAVPPTGKAVGAERQIYSAGSNEGAYTDLWTNRFFGFRNLLNTVRNTGTPIRVKPFNIYYHMYSGQKAASLAALRHNLDAARAAEIAPVTASTYAAMAEGFYSTRLIPDGPRRWRVAGRGALATVRFDYGAFTAVDFARSAGVLGQRHSQGSLYVALDPAVDEPVVALAETDRADIEPPATRPSLVHGRWPLRGLVVDGDGLGWRVEGRGFGAGAMVWRVPSPGTYGVWAARGDEVVWYGTATTDSDGLLAFTVAAAADAAPLVLRVRRNGDRAGG